MIHKRSVCIIGAGGSGLAALRNCLENDEECEFVLQPMVFEQRDGIGGLWNYCENKEDIINYSPLYKDLRTNLPKEIMFYLDFKWDQYKIDQNESYPDHETVLQYLNDYTDHHQLRKHIKFNSKVKRVSKIPNIENEYEPRWKVAVENVQNGEMTVYEFDSIIVCSGHYRKPRTPQNFDQIQKTFKGEILHGLDYKRPQIFTDQKVIVCGGGPSGIDIAISIAKYASEVSLSLKEIDKFQFGNLESVSNLRQVGKVLEAKANSFIIEGGEEIDCDVVIFCIGYEYNYPYFEDGIIQVKDDGMQLTPLYRHMVNRKCHTLAFIGIPYLIAPFIMFDVQTRFYTQYLRGCMKLPTESQMLEDYENDQEMRKPYGLTGHRSHMMLIGQFPYYKMLEKLSDDAGFGELYQKIINPQVPLIYKDTMNNIRNNALDYKKYHVEIIEKDGQETTFKYHGKD